MKRKEPSARRLRLETLEPRQLLTVQLVADVELANFGSNPMEFTALGELALFVAQDSQPERGFGGFQVYASDGSEEGTVTLHRFDDRRMASNFLVVGEQAYFATSLEHGEQQQLWRTDGTRQGTQLVKQLAELSQFGAQNFVAAADHIYYEHGGGPNKGLWRSDGTEAGTVRLTEKAAGDAVPVGDSVFFLAFDEEHGGELWYSDGTEDGARLVKDVRPGQDSSRIRFPTGVGDKLYFFADDGTHGYELWSSDGTENGTELVKDLALGMDGPRPAGHLPRWTYATDQLLYFSTSLKGVGQELYRSDGTPGGTALLKDINEGPFGSDPQPLGVAGSEFLFRVSGIDNALWVTGGTPDDTRPFERTEAGFSWEPDEVFLDGPIYMEVGDRPAMLFSRSNQEFGREFWVDDGTPAGPRILVDAVPGPGDSIIGGSVKVGASIFYGGDDGTNGWELWTTDGTAEGTGMLKNIANPGTFGSGVRFPKHIDGLTYFLAQRSAPPGEHLGIEIWVSDGTPEGTRPLKDINEGSNGQPNVDPNFTKVGDTVFFLAHDDATGLEVWKTDGTEAGTALVRDIHLGPEASIREINPWENPRQFHELDGEAYFVAYDGRGTEIWKSDGTEAGTQRVTRLRRDGRDPKIFDMTRFGDAIYFGADDGVNGHELWRLADGVAEIVTTLQPGPRGSVPNLLTVVGDSMFFTATTQDTGAELWITDGTAEGTRLVRDISLGHHGAGPNEFAVLDGLLYFTAETIELGRELWVSDGTLRGTRLVADIFPKQESSFPGHLTVVDDQLFFLASHPDTGRELWVSDGTQAGTRIVKDLKPNEDLQVPDLLVVGDKIAFAVRDDQTGRSEIWLSDGTPERTTRIETLQVTDVNSISAAEGVLYLAADDNVAGEELWSIDVLNPSTPQVTSTSLNEIGGTVFELNSLSFTFSHDVSASLSVEDLSIVDSGTGATLPPAVDFSWNVETFTGTWIVADGIQPGHYTARLNGSDVQDTRGVLLDGNHDFVEGDDHEYQFSIFIAGDANTDGVVAFSDFVAMAEHFGMEGTTPREGDFNGDGRVSFEDFILLSRNFGKRLGQPNG